jgi:putative transposase
VDFENGTTSIPKVNSIKTVFERRFEGQVKTVTVSMEPTGKFFVSFLVEDGKDLPKKEPIDPSKAIGIDLGLTSFLTTSNGEKVDNPRFLKKDHARIRRLSRIKSRRAKGGKNRAKARRRLALAHEKARNRRRDFLHKLSTRLVRENQAVCVEDLSVKGMLKNHRLARSISDAAWGEFMGMLRYKSEWQGKHLLEIGRFDPSSKMCSVCGAINQGLTLKDRSWECPSCHAEHDRDMNAARNIRRMALDRQNLIGKVPMDSRELMPGEIAH